MIRSKPRYDFLLSDFWRCKLHLLACIYLFIGCRPNGVNPLSAVATAIPSHQAKVVEAKPPDTIHIRADKRPVQVTAGKPVIIEDATHGGLPYFSRPLSDEAPGLHSVISSYCDSEGSFWLGTAGAGICRYNGKSFVFYDFSKGLGSNVVFAIYQDSKGNMWFGTSAGLSKYDGYSIKSFSLADGLAGNMVTSITGKGNELWIGTQGGGLSKYDGLKFTTYNTQDGLSDNYVRCLLTGKDGRIWIGTASGGLNVYDGKKFTAYSTADGLISNSIARLAQDKHGMLWLGTNQGLSRFDGSTFASYSAANGLAETDVASLLIDNADNIWMGSPYGKLTRFDGSTFRTFLIGGKEDASPVSSIFQDKGGNIWFTKIGGGVSRYMEDHIKRLGQQQGLVGNLVFAIEQDSSHRTWMGSYRSGLSVYDGKVFRNYTKAQGLPDDWIWNIMRDRDNNMWIGTDHGGVCKFDGEYFTSFTTKQGLLSNSVTSMMQDKNGRMWFGTPSGVSVFDGSSFINFTTKQGLPGESVMGCVEDDQGNIWIATHDDGVCRYDGRQFEWFKKEDGLASNSVYSIIKDQHGNIWIGTNSGLTWYDGKKFISFTTAEGMADNYIWIVTEDRARNIIWAGSNKGITALKPDSMNGTYSIENFNEQTGYPIRQATNGLLVGNDGVLWIASGHNEVIRFDYEHAGKPSSADPLLRIENVKVNQATVPWHYVATLNNGKTTYETQLAMMEFGSDLSTKFADSLRKKYSGIRVSKVNRFYATPEDLKLPYPFNTVSIDFAAIDPVMQKQIRYQYKLDGYSSDWSPLSENATAVFGNISPGNYNFRVKAFTPTGRFAEKTFAFSVLPPWWLTWWAYSLAAILIIGFLFGVYRLRIANLHRKQAAQIRLMVATQEEERKRLARDLHDDIGIKLSALKMFISSMQEKAVVRADDEIKTLAERSEGLIGETVKDVRQILVNLSPTVVEEFGYTTAVEGLVNKINQTRALEFQLVIFGMNGRLQKDYELALYRITQELINNVLKHAAAKHVSLQIGRRDEKIILLVEDDGRGFNVEQKKDGHGLNNLDIRTRLLNGRMTVDSRPGKGTSVLIEIPYSPN